ncbi:MAG: hypothetical protein CMB56_004985 [Methanobacteriota archaeon]|nr:MAG: hypothetical protein CMB56_004985 [Euryarchaeota archaeon]|tara:strand:+ start:1844 stop:2617 length:774 start_codon:yes stop_codon:yes gene_type:complete
MSKSRDYFDGLITQGYEKSKALEYTLKYFPDFSLDESTTNTTDSNLSAEKVVAALIDALDLKNNQIEIPDKKSDEEKESKFQLTLAYIEAFFHVILEPFSDKKVRMTALGITGLIIIAIFAFNIPKTTDPIIGTWIKPDGQKISFEEDFVYTDGVMQSSNWTLASNILTIYSSGEWVYENGSKEKYSLIQEIKIDFSKDDNAIWMKWNKITIDSEIQPLPEVCLLVINDKIIKNNDDFSSESEEYLEDKPDWCSIQE